MAIINLYETEEIKCAQTAQRCVSLKGSGRGRAARGSLQRIWGWGWGPRLSTALGAPPHLLVSPMCAAVPRDSIPGVPGGDAHPILLAPPGAVRTHRGRSPLPPAAVRGGWCEPAPGGLNPAASQQAAPEDCEELRLSPAPKESEQ